MSSHIFCNNCGEKNDALARICKKCGNSVVIQKRILSTGTLLDNRYEIKRLIKSGGMGTVYEALDERFSNIPCAIKEMTCDTSDETKQTYLINRFKKEAEMLHSLRHPNLPVVKDYFVHQGLYYLVMDYIEGKDLESIMRSYGERGIPEYRVIEWSKEILEAFKYLHSQNPPIVYRDLKPGNVMLRNSDGKIILVDFGIARPVDPGTLSSKTVIGTPAFSPEEIFQGNPEPRSDIYSLGATMHSLLTGIIPTCPFSFSPVRNINPAVSEEVAEIISRALEREPKDRFPDASAMKRAIDELTVTIPPEDITIFSTDEIPLDSHAPTIDPSSYSGGSSSSMKSPHHGDIQKIEGTENLKAGTENITPEKERPQSLKRSCLFGCGMFFLMIFLTWAMIAFFRNGKPLPGFIMSGFLWYLVIRLYFNTIKPAYKKMMGGIKNKIVKK